MIRPFTEIELWPTTSPGNQPLFYSDKPRKPACYKVGLGGGHAGISTRNLKSKGPLSQLASSSQNFIDWLAASLILVPASNLRLEKAKDVPLTDHIKCPISRKSTYSCSVPTAFPEGRPEGFFPHYKAFPLCCLPWGSTTIPMLVADVCNKASVNIPGSFLFGWSSFLSTLVYLRPLNSSFAKRTEKFLKITLRILHSLLTQFDRLALDFSSKGHAFHSRKLPL